MRKNTETEMLAKRLKIITYGQAYAIDISHPRRISADIIAELWMIPLERFSDDSVTLFRQVDEYVAYAYGENELPRWYKDGDISLEW